MLASPLTQAKFSDNPWDRAVRTSHFLIRKEAKTQSPTGYRLGRRAKM